MVVAGLDDDGRISEEERAWYIRDLTGPVRSLEKRVEQALELGAIAYVPPRPSLKKGRGKETEDEEAEDESEGTLEGGLE